jgi:hypothetical protein
MLLSIPTYATEKEALVGSKRQVRKLVQVNGSKYPDSVM